MASPGPLSQTLHTLGSTGGTSLRFRFCLLLLLFIESNKKLGRGGVAEEEDGRFCLRGSVPTEEQSAPLRETELRWAPPFFNTLHVT